MKQKKPAAFCSDRISDEYLEVNSCGIEKIFKRDRGSLRPDGRKDYHVIYVEKGILNLFLDGEWKRLPEGRVVVFRPGERQEYKYLKDDKSISHYIHFSGGGCEKLCYGQKPYLRGAFGKACARVYRQKAAVRGFLLGVSLSDVEYNRTKVRLGTGKRNPYKCK